MNPEVAPSIAITCGEPAGIGAEITLKALAQHEFGKAHFHLVADAELLKHTAQQIGLSADFFQQKHISLAQVPILARAVPGQLNVANAAYVLKTLDVALEGTQAGQFDAIVTAPVQKSIINQAGFAFSGHTEYLADKTHTPQVVMMLAGRTQAGVSKDNYLRVALATTHLPLSQVSAAITFDGLLRTLQIIDADLKTKFGLLHPQILVTGLNPHAGEEGVLGREEIEVIQPALLAAQKLGIHALGPYPADTLFQPKYLQQADCVLAMYHDQGLPVLKHATFGRGINVTLGLPIIRTSVDHGTALDLAGKNCADAGSMVEAIHAALDMVRAQQK